MPKLLLRHFFMMKFKIVEQRKNFIGRITNAQWAALSFFILVFLILKIGTNEYLGLILGFLSFGILSLIIYSTLSYETLNADIVGDLIFDEDLVEIKLEMIHYDEIQNMELYTNHYKSQSKYPGPNSFFGPWNYIGKSNYLKVKCFDQRIFNVEFQILSLCDFKNINEFYANLLLTGKISLYSHSLHKVPIDIKQTSSFLLYVIKLVDEKVIGKQYSQRVLSDRYNS